MRYRIKIVAELDTSLGEPPEIKSNLARFLKEKGLTVDDEDVYVEPMTPAEIESTQGDQEIRLLGKELCAYGKKVEVPTWQALDVRSKPQSSTHELESITFTLQIPAQVDDLAVACGPYLPWAENQFLERVSGEPLNPGETFKGWPWYKGNVEQHKEQGQFSHTYMERYWPKYNLDPDGFDASLNVPPRKGIRFDYGDLGDVVNLLAREPTTRQAYLPVFFPEDTGAHHRQRVPCSLGYLFLMREGKLNITYHMRSCDFYRHFRDDVYMTARLCQWVIEQLREGNMYPDPDEVTGWDYVTPGRLTMHIGSLHVFESDLPRLRSEYAS